MIKPLEELSFRARLGLLVAIVIVVLLAMMLIVDWTARAQRPQAEPSALTNTKWDARIAELERQAMEEAFKKHLIQLFSVWVTDNYQPNFPPRALISARNARDAFVRTMNAIEQREKKLEEREKK